MIPTYLTDRLNQNVKFNPSLAHNLEHSMGLVGDTREYQGSTGKRCEDSIEETEEERLANPY